MLSNEPIGPNKLTVMIYDSIWKTHERSSSNYKYVKLKINWKKCQKWFPCC